MKPVFIEIESTDLISAPVFRQVLSRNGQFHTDAFWVFDMHPSDKAYDIESERKFVFLGDLYVIRQVHIIEVNGEVRLSYDCLQARRVK